MVWGFRDHSGDLDAGSTAQPAQTAEVDREDTGSLKTCNAAICSCALNGPVLQISCCAKRTQSAVMSHPTNCAVRLAGAALRKRDCQHLFSRAFGSSNWSVIRSWCRMQRAMLICSNLEKLLCSTAQPVSRDLLYNPKGFCSTEFCRISTLLPVQGLSRWLLLA